MAATAIRTVMLSLALASIGASAPAFAETLRFKADLLPVAGTGSTASGNVIADYDTDSKKFTWSGSYKGVATYATSASFHGAPDGPRRGFVRIQTIDSPFAGLGHSLGQAGRGSARRRVVDRHPYRRLSQR